jgi:two-component system chemotaxis response regulator CheB
LKTSPLIVIGASAGGVSALRSIVSGLGQRFEAPILIVLHVGAHPSLLPEVLTAAGSLGAKHAEHGERIRPRQIYIAPPDHHMMVEDGCVLLKRGPKVNWARPAIDPLFQSAADSYGPNAIGVILSGNLNDGTLGLHAIKRRGGITIVQDPQDAECPDMPRSAAAHVQVDYCSRVADIPGLLVRLSDEHQEAIESSLSAIDESPIMNNDEEFDRPLALACPECGGALRRIEHARMVEFRCHIRHVYTAEILCEAHFDLMEGTLRAAERIVNERAELCRQMAERATSEGTAGEVHLWRAAEAQATDRAIGLRDFVEQDWIRPQAAPAAEPAI